MYISIAELCYKAAALLTAEKAACAAAKVAAKAADKVAKETAKQEKAAAATVTLKRPAATVMAACALRKKAKSVDGTSFIIAIVRSKHSSVCLLPCIV